MGSTCSDEQQRFEALYEAHRRQVMAYCLRRVNATDAADACSETFLVAWRRIDEVPQAPKTLPFLYGVAARVIANQRRGNVRRGRLDARLDALGVVPPADPSVVSVQRAEDDKVVAAVRRLKPKDREIVMLYAWEDLPREVIAEMMGLTRSAIDQRIHRCYRRLARLLRPDAMPLVDSPPIARERRT